MIVSASYRSDIPAFHARWFAERLAIGHATVRNPYGGRDFTVPLTGDAVDGFVFWTRNLNPFRPVLARIGAPFVVQFTITGYPRRLEPRVPDTAVATGQLRWLANRFGRVAGVWRYDPVIRTAHLDDAWHRRTFTGIADALRGAVDEVVISLMAPYAKTRRNLAPALREGEVADHDVAAALPLFNDLVGIAGARGMRLTACTLPATDAAPGPAIGPARCIDAARLSRVAGRTITARTRGNRKGCLCAESRDIGAYDSCGHGCVYCYAVGDHGRALARLRAPERRR